MRQIIFTMIPCALLLIVFAPVLVALLGGFDAEDAAMTATYLHGISGNPGKQRFEKAVSGMYLGDILKATFPLEEFEEKFAAQKLTSIMNLSLIHI